MKTTSIVSSNFSIAFLPVSATIILWPKFLRKADIILMFMTSSSTSKIVFLSTLPITVLMNSFRIGVIGVLVDNWGIEQAEGFLHDFEGWVIFIGCLGILFVEMWLMVKLFIKDKTFSEVFVVGVVGALQNAEVKTSETNSPSQTQGLQFFGMPRAYLASLLVFILITPYALSIGDREELIPDRSRFSHWKRVWRSDRIGLRGLCRRRRLSAPGKAKRIVFLA